MREGFARFGLFSPRGIRISILQRLILSFLLIIIIISAVFIIVGIRLISDRIVADAQEQVRHDLNAAREIYGGELRHIRDVVHLTADRYSLRNAMLLGDISQIEEELKEVKKTEGLDILTLVDASNAVVYRTNRPQECVGCFLDDDLVDLARTNVEPVAATALVPAVELNQESARLAAKAYITLIDTPKAREIAETKLSDAMMLKAAAPVVDHEGAVLGVLFGGTLINRNYEIVDTIKQTVYEDLTYGEKDIGTATIFQDDVRISTNVRDNDGRRAVGTRVSEEVYDQVVVHGEPWLERAYVVNDWYITAYEPIRDINDKIIGILYVGVLEQPYEDIQREAVGAFLVITLLGTLGAMVLAYFLSRRISVPIKRMAAASQEIAGGNLEATVEVNSNDELGDLADTFNVMALSLKQRDDQLKEYTKSKIMETERLALVGQLAANVAHELNNPLQGIVTYSHLLLEKMPKDATESKEASYLERIVTQANRCRDIIRGLLDFSRQRKPDTTVCDLNAVVEECLTFVENQASFQNIKIVENFDSNLPMTIADPSQMQQVFLNMIINAAEAMDEDGTLTVETHHNTDLNTIDISIKDTGYGIPEENFKKLFDPFFTTKEVGHGTGLGLAISYGIIKEHGGDILVESKVGEGSTFLIRLPLEEEEVIVHG